MKLRSLLAACISTLLFAASAAPALAAGVAADVTASVSGRYTGATNITTPLFPISVNKTNQFANGTGTGNADKLYVSERTLAASATENLDMAGALTDPLGASLTFVKVKAILVVANAANTNNVCFGGAASNTFVGPFADATDVMCVKPGGMALVSDPIGWSVTASTGDILKVANSSSGTGVTYRIVIIGASA